MEDFKQKFEIKVKHAEEATEEEIAYICKGAKTVKAPDNILLEGEAAENSKPRYKEVKGENDEFIDRKW